MEQIVSFFASDPGAVATIVAGMISAITSILIAVLNSNSNTSKETTKFLLLITKIFFVVLVIFLSVIILTSIGKIITFEQPLIFGGVALFVFALYITFNARNDEQRRLISLRILEEIEDDMFIVLNDNNPILTIDQMKERLLRNVNLSNISNKDMQCIVKDLWIAIQTGFLVRVRKKLSVQELEYFAGLIERKKTTEISQVLYKHLDEFKNLAEMEMSYIIEKFKRKLQK